MLFLHEINIVKTLGSTEAALGLRARAGALISVSVRHSFSSNNSQIERVKLHKYLDSIRH